MITNLKKISLCILPLFLFNGCMDDSVASAPTEQTPQESTVKPGEAIAQLGNLANANVSIFEMQEDGSFSLRWKEKTSSSETLDEIGHFYTHLEEFQPNHFYLFSVEGGEDWDYNDDGILDQNYTINLGTIHALATTEDIQYAGTNFKVTIASEILYELVQRDLHTDLNTTQLKALMDQYAQTIVTDIDSNGKIDTRDVLVYSRPSYKPMLQEKYKEQLSQLIENIHVGDIALENLIITSDANYTILENETYITQLTAQDLDGDTLHWSFSGGNDKTFFTISDDGKLYFEEAPDFENPQDNNHDNTYEVSVEVTDSIHTDTKTLLVSVLNYNDTPPSSTTPTNITLPESYSKVVQLTGNDVDKDSLTWSISGGEDASLFNIDTNTSTLFFNEAPDYEEPLDNDNNGIYEVSLTLSDGEHNVSQTLDITITDIIHEAFIMEIKTDNNGSSSSTQFTIPTKDDGYNYNVDCDNDGIFESNATSGDYTCEYDSAGTYEVVIFDNSHNATGFPRIYFNNEGDKDKLIAIKQWGAIEWTSMQGAFYGCNNFNNIEEGVPNLSIVKSMNNMFKDALNFNQDIGTWDTSSVEDMSSMFYGAISFNQDIGQWNTSSVKNMAYMFKSALSFNQDIGQWNTAQVIDMNNMFNGTLVFNQNINLWDVSKVENMNSLFKDNPVFNQPLNEWNTQSVIDMYGVFYNASSFNQDIGTWNTSNVETFESMFKNNPVFNQNIGDWNITTARKCNSMFYGATSFNGSVENWDVSNVENMYSMFKNATHFNQTLHNWNTVHVTNMNSMFYGAEAFNENIENFDTKNVTDMGSMFKDAYHFNQDISQWNTAQVIDMHSMFYNAAAFDQDLGAWDLSNVQTLNAMFKGALRFNQDIGSWNTSNVTDMNSMFYGANNFNQDISLWNTQNVTDMASMFKDAFPFNSPLNNWNTSNVTDMSSMFKNLTDFNQDLQNWDTSNVVNMNNMFYNAQNFNGDISQWNVENVTDMYYMFKDAPLFNQDIGEWNTANVTTMKGMFYGATSFNQDIGKWDTTQVTDMSAMFKYTNDFDQPIGYWNTENVIDMSSMFYGAVSFNQNISRWNTSKVVTMESMFYNAENFANHDLSDWDVSSVIEHTNFMKNAGEGNIEPNWSN